MEHRVAQIESFWTRRSGLLSAIVVVVVAASGYLLDRFLLREGMPKAEMLVLTNLITGIVAGSFLFYLARHEKTQRQLICERMKTIAELNHHIRNALQVIKYYGAVHGQGPEARSVQMINESAHRIEWALRELLPQYPEDSTVQVRPQPPGYAAVGSRTVPIGAFSDQKTGVQ
jgi:hypothetical protein